MPSGIRDDASACQPTPTAILSRRLFSLVIRALVITTMSFGVAFGFLSGTTGSHYDPYSFAIGVAALFGASCGAMGILISRIRQMKAELRKLEASLDQAADRNWEIREAQERDKNFFEAQGDVIVRRDVNGAITYANDAFCRLAGRAREDLLGTAFALPVEEQGVVAFLADGTQAHDQSILTSEGPALDRLARGRRARRRRQRDAKRRPRRHRPRRGGAGARRGARSGRGGEPREIALPRHSVARDPHAAQRHPRHDRSAARHRAQSGTDDLCQCGEDVGRDAAVADRGNLDFSKIEAGRLDLSARPFALAGFVEEIVELLGPRAQAKGLEICAYVDERLPASVVGDAARLRQVLFNLAGNAIKFTERGGVSIVVEAGSGAARKFGGTGLGLAISKKILESMNGAIAVESVPGEGATFRVAVVLARSSDAGEDGFVAPDLTGS